MPPPLRPVPRATLAAACVLTAALGATLIGPASEPGHRDPAAAAAAIGAASAAPIWARTASGQLAQVDARRYPTPVDPETLTHPEADSMGSTVRAHEPPAGVAPNPISQDSAVPHLPGIDVSSNQGSINWAAVAPRLDFVYAKATEGTYYRNPDFAAQYDGPHQRGVIRGAYHFAVPSNSSGGAQADYFIAHGGAWNGDGTTLPGALDIEYNPYGKACYGLSAAAMTGWIWNFVNEYAAREHVYPVIYSTTDWWRSCTGNASGFGRYDPFWVANYGSDGGGTLPAGWRFYTFWQYSDHGRVPGDQDVFNGALAQLRRLAGRD
ncbi:lysozyme [Actinospica durhamensis]|uniref:lysozyme n=1 Tax=Actinospica durhamensis TaxID=1508375 RepID=A0A941EWJ5_9ACTN|nr:lysozyme [Actinospica durhamensis]MBR7839492.1 lysozyme [Actinospica durhamensis]